MSEWKLPCVNVLGLGGSVGVGLGFGWASIVHWVQLAITRVGHAISQCGPTHLHDPAVALKKYPYMRGYKCLYPYMLGWGYVIRYLDLYLKYPDIC